MKTIFCKILIVLIIMLFSRISFSYTINIIKPNPCHCRPEEATMVLKYTKKPIITNVTMYPNSLNYTNSTGIAICNLSRGENVNFEWRDSNATVYPIHFLTIQPNKVKVIAGLRGKTISEGEEIGEYYLFVRASNNYGSTGWVKRKVIITPSLIECPLIQHDMSGTKIYENSAIVGSNGEFKKDFYLHRNPELQSQTNIDFNIEESGNDISYIDQVVLTQVKVKKGEYVAVDDNGEIINYAIDSIKSKIIINDETDVSDALAFNDGEDIKLEKSNKLSVDAKVDGGGYVIINSHSPVNKEAIAGVLTTSNGNQYTFRSRDNENYSCIKLKESSISDFTIIANQDLFIEQVLIVKNLGTGEIKNLSLKSAIHNKFGDVTNLLSETDGSLVEISRDLSTSLEFENEITNDKQSFYVQETTGKVIKTHHQLSNDKKEEINLSFENKLHANFPNPFNPVTNISFEIPADGFVNLKVYDVSGRVVNTLVNKYKKAGKYEIRFDGSKLSSGIYFYTIESNGFRKTKRMTLIK